MDEWSVGLTREMALASATCTEGGDCMNYDSALPTLQLRRNEYNKFIM